MGENLKNTYTTPEVEVMEVKSTGMPTISNDDPFWSEFG